MIDYDLNRGDVETESDRTHLSDKESWSREIRGLAQGDAQGPCGCGEAEQDLHSAGTPRLSLARTYV